MNDRRAGELVVHVADSGMDTNSIIQSQKIMSEDTGHYILIKRGTAPIDSMCYHLYISFIVVYANIARISY